LTDPLTRKVTGTPQLWRLLHPASLCGALENFIAYRSNAVSDVE